MPRERAEICAIPGLVDHYERPGYDQFLAVGQILRTRGCIKTSLSRVIKVEVVA
jgi:hypothetical protein